MTRVTPFWSTNGPWLLFPVTSRLVLPKATQIRFSAGQSSHYHSRATFLPIVAAALARRAPHGLAWPARALRTAPPEWHRSNGFPSFTSASHHQQQARAREAAIVLTAKRTKREKREKKKKNFWRREERKKRECLFCGKHAFPRVLRTASYTSWPSLAVAMAVPRRCGHGSLGGCGQGCRR